MKELAASANAAVEGLDRALHKIMVVECIVEMFVSNPWLDAIILQEVNDFACFSSLLIEYSKGKVALDIHQGAKPQVHIGRAKPEGDVPDRLPQRRRTAATRSSSHQRLGRPNRRRI